MTPRQGTAAPGAKAWCFGMLLLALVLRICVFPARDDIRDPDEIGYVTSGLVMWESTMPTERAVPAAEQTWCSWAYVAARSGWEFVHLHNVPGALKPLKAIEQALFKTYEDPGGLRLLLLWISIGIALVGVYSAYRLGAKYSGPPGGVLTAGLAAALPLFVEYAGISKSCSDAWMFGIAAVSCAGILTGAKRQWSSGILLGFAVASRIDMLVLAPVVLWMLWDNQNSERFWESAIKIAVIAPVTTVLAAPWMLTGIVGMLRTIVLSRVVGYWPMDSPRLEALKELAWQQGLGPVLAATLVGLVLAAPGTRRKRWLLAAFAGLLAASMFGKSHQPIRYHAGPIIGLLILATVAVGPLFARLSKPLAIAGSLLVLLLPLAQSVRTIQEWKSFYAPDQATDWVEKNVPAGTIVYLRCTATVKALLPTEAAADANWNFVAGEQAWRRKIEDGLKRFSLPKDELPRAMSEDNLVMDKGFCRRWFILGGGKTTRPRYELRVLDVSKTSGWHLDHLVEDFKNSGGVILWRSMSDSRPPEGLGEPSLKWVNDKGFGSLVYLSPELHRKLIK